MSALKQELPPVPAKRYFTIGEVADLCLVKQHVLRYWEQEFAQLKPMKRRGNRRYYQHHEVMLIRKIRSLLYDDGFTINGARTKLDSLRGREAARGFGDVAFERIDEASAGGGGADDDGLDDDLEIFRTETARVDSLTQIQFTPGAIATATLRAELVEIRGLLV